MPTLNFKGKALVWNHHLSVPYHLLEDQPEHGFRLESHPENLLIEGDNLLALKALLPRYAGQIKCIYIDPPYNTGNEGWAYNDHVNSPLMKKWLGETVGKDLLDRHDRWLCMMTPRLKLLHELLKEDGVIFISIDDNAKHLLRLLCDEIFGEHSYIMDFVWKRRTGANDSKEFFRSIDHEYIVCYTKNKINSKPNKEDFRFFGIDKNEERYSNPDDDPRGPWTISDLTCSKTYEERENLFYSITDPKTGIIYDANPNRVWAYEPDKMAEHIANGKVIFPKKADGTPMYKRHLSELRSMQKPLSSWVYPSNENMEGEDVLNLKFPLNTAATKELKALFEAKVFDYPKASLMVKAIIGQATGPNDIILDSFAGSGTTGHAVMALNKEDGGNRRFILCQMPENTEKEPDKNIARDITAERLRRAAEKFGYAEGFRYQKVGAAIDVEAFATGQLPPLVPFGNYVLYLATGAHATATRKPVQVEGQADLYFCGRTEALAVYMVYAEDRDVLRRIALTREAAIALHKANPSHRVVVYAPACFVSEEELERLSVAFVGIPYNLFELDKPQ